MEIIQMKPKVLSQKIIAHVSDEFARTYQLPEDHQSVAFFSVDNDDSGYLAVDDATKKANIRVVHAETFYGGSLCSWSKYGGSVFIMFSGPKVADVRSGLGYVNDFVEKRTALYNFDGDTGTAFYAQCIPRVGKYYQELCGMEEGTSYAYLVGGPIETNYALDKALKAGETQVVKYWYPPSHANSSGAILAGSESACRSATLAFVDALRYATQHPFDI
ncbi:MAG: ethanolamine utilization microcompartment protein EutL [Clostridiales bacterium]|nr:ethanolamine utilization microcompartment protein EutL [Clostridiales bacterium]